MVFMMITSGVMQDDPDSIFSDMNFLASCAASFPFLPKAPTEGRVPETL